jgi:uncharacterized cupredoxin-like copper-binding protein
MTETSPDLETDAGRPSKPGTPRWVKVFGVISLVLIVLVVLMLTGVLGKGHGPGRHLGGARGAMPHQKAGGIGGPADAEKASRTVEATTLDTMSFQPATIAVSKGETVTFVVTNAGQSVHEFTLGDAGMQQAHAQAIAHIPAGMSHEFPNSIMLQPGQTKRLTWRFGDTATLEYACHVLNHYQAGMRGQITLS